MTSATVSQEIAKRVLGVLPFEGHEGLTYQQVHAKVGRWALVTIKHGLRQLREDDLVLREGTHPCPRFVRRRL